MINVVRIDCPEQGCENYGTMCSVCARNREVLRPKDHYKRHQELKAVTRKRNPLQVIKGGKK